MNLPTHGSLTKAGKVKGQTPKVERVKTSSSPIPRISNRISYTRLLFNKQNRSWRRRRRRRR
jgi:small subunit ribosomal protein S30e